MVDLLAAHAVEVLLPGAVLGDELASEGARLDLREDFLHRLARLLADDPGAASQIAVFGGVGDRLAHPADALLIHQVDDELELVQALEVGQARVVAGVDQRLVAGADELGEAAAEHRLLAEEVGLGLLAEASLDDAGARAADALGVGEGQRPGVAGGVLVDGDQPGDAASLLELATHEVAGALGRHQRDVHLGGRRDLAVVHREAVTEEQEVARRDAVGDLLAPDVAVLLVGQQDHHHVAARSGVGDVEDLEAGRLRLRDRRRSRAQSDDHLHPGLLEVQCVGVALGAVAEDGDGLAVELGEIRVVVVEHGRGRLSDGPRRRFTRRRRRPTCALAARERPPACGSPPPSRPARRGPRRSPRRAPR